MGVSICADSEELSRDYSWSIWCFLLRIARVWVGVGWNS